MRDDGAYISHIVDAIDKVTDYIQCGEDEFLQNSQVQDAVIRNLEVIGEAVRHLSQDLKAKHPDIPWRQISGMRDKLIHQYFGVKLDVVWETAVRVLPDFRERISRLV